MVKITILNSITMCITFSILTSKFYIIHNKVKFIIYFATILAENIFFRLFFKEIYFIPQYLMIFLTFLYVYDKKSKLYSLYSSIKVSFYIYVLVMFSGSVLFLVFEKINIEKDILYNLFMGVFLITASYFIKKINFNLKIEHCKNTLIIETILNVLVIIFISIIMPHLPVFKDMYSYNVITFSFSILLILVYSGLNYLHKLQMEIFKSKINSEYLLKKEEYIKEQQEQNIVYKHSVKRLISCILEYIEKEDIKSLKSFYVKYVSPINQDILNDKNIIKLLDMINHELLHNFMYSVVNEATIYGINLLLNINTIIDKIALNDTTLIQICSIYIQNAIEEVKSQGNGFIAININQKNKVFTFKVENSIINGESLKKPYNSHRGFEIVRSLSSKYPNIETHNFKKINTYVQVLGVFYGQYI